MAELSDVAGHAMRSDRTRYTMNDELINYNETQ
jgi:hypothetical protein